VVAARAEGGRDEGTQGDTTERQEGDLVQAKVTMSHDSNQVAEELKPVDVGSVGNIYDQFRGKAKEAIQFILKRGEGNAVAALHHKDVGDIDLWYGNDKAGLKKIAEKHPEVLDDLQGIIDQMHVVKSSDNRIVLESETHRAVVSKMLGTKRLTTGCCRPMRRKEPPPAVVTLKRNRKASGMAQLLRKVLFLKAKVRKIPKPTRKLRQKSHKRARKSQVQGQAGDTTGVE
jgi:hypothetical protein